MANPGTQKAKLGKGRHLSAIKRHRQSLKRKARNKHVLTGTKTAVKNARSAISLKDKEKINTAVKNAISSLAKAAAKGVIPKGRASRLCSKLASAAHAVISA